MANKSGQLESVCKTLYGMEPCEHMFLLCNRLLPKDTNDGEPCSGGLPLIPYDGGVPDDIVRREYQRGTYRTQIVIQEPGKRPSFSSKCHPVEIPEGEPIIPRASKTPARNPRKESDELIKLREQLAQLMAAAQAPQAQPAKPDAKHDKLRRLVREAREKVAKLERERDEERRQREADKRAQQEREERARDRAELAQLFQQGAQAITALGDRLDTALEDTKGSLLDEVDERIGKLGGGASPPTGYAMAFQAGERILDKYADAKKEERAVLLEERLKEQERERETERGKLLAQLGQEQERARQLEAELKKRGNHVP